MLDPENIPYDVIERAKARRYEVVNKSRRLEKRASGFTIHIDETSATFLFLGVILGVILGVLLNDIDGVTDGLKLTSGD